MLFHPRRGTEWRHQIWQVKPWTRATDIAAKRVQRKEQRQRDRETGTQRDRVAGAQGHRRAAAGRVLRAQDPYRLCLVLSLTPV